MKKLFTLSFVILGLLLPATAMAQTFSEGGIEYQAVADGNVTVTGGTAEGELSIPATIAHDGQNYTVTAIADEAFKGSAVTTLDLSQAASLQRIGTSAFEECGQLETVIFPARESSKLKEIGSRAFCHDFALKQMNLEDTRIVVLETLFTLEESDEISIPGLTSLALPETLLEIKPYALQCLDIKEIEIPSAVTKIGDYVLQGCINLKTFTWKGAQITSLPLHTFAFVGESLVKVTLLTVEPLQPDGLTDRHFYRIGANPAPAEVILTPESIASLATAGYTNETSIFSTLVAYSGDDGPTAIASPQRSDRQASECGAYYNLQGIRIANPQPGCLYIRNGRKTVYRPFPS